MEYTFQDYQHAADKHAFILDAVKARKAAPAFRQALEAVSYFRGQNTEVARKTVARASVRMAVRL